MKHFLIALLVAISASTLNAQQLRQSDAPANYLDGVGIDQKLDAQIPLDATFRDESGNPVQLSQYFGKRPVILALVYYQCPMLCTMVLNDLGRALNAMPTDVGKDFDIVTISFDPSETSKLASDKKTQYLRAYRRPTAAQGWHFLTGDDTAIRAVTDAVGFHYKWDDRLKQFVHAGGLMVITPSGRISKYFYGIEYSGRDLRLATAEAGGGKIGSPAEQFLLYCFHYDPRSGKYTLAVTRLLQTGAVMTLLALGSFWFFMFKRERKVSLRPASI